MTELAGLTSAEAGERAAGGAFLVVPVASIEQHGPHLPLSTDTDLAVALCAGLARARPDAVIAPPLAYGSSGEHQDFPGTLSIGQDALELVLVELCRSATCTFPGVLLVSTHGGNAAVVRRAERRLRAESRDVRAWLAASGRRRPRGPYRDLAPAGHGPRPGPPGPGRAGQHASRRRAHARPADIVGPRGQPQRRARRPGRRVRRRGRRVLAALLADLLGTVRAWRARA